MSIIQSIRDKAAAIIFGAIAVSLIAFLLQDAFYGRGSGSSNRITSLKEKIGSVNGESVTYEEFSKKLNFYESLQQKNGQQLNENSRQQINDAVWDEFVTAKIMDPIYEDLGITVTQKEINDQLFGATPPQFMQQAFTDPNTGQYNAAQAKDFIKNLKKPKRNENEAFYAEYLDNTINVQMVSSDKQRKYSALLMGAAYYPKWLADKENADNSAAANFSYVAVPYSSIADSTIKISDEEINAYVQNHKDQFKQDKSAELAYVIFDGAPTAADSLKIFNDVAALKPKFVADTSAQAFLSLNNSVQPYYDGFVAKSKIQVPNKDSIFALSKNAVYGPYLDADSRSGVGNYVLAKLIDIKPMPDSVICRHILLSAQKTPDSIGKTRIDSIAEAINKGASFVKLMKQYSDDEASKTQDSLGKMRFSADEIQNAQSFDQDFAKFILYDGTAGQRKVVKTKFGWHLIEILEQKNFEPFYKVAYYAQRIEPSNETSSKANADASAFAAEAGKDVKTFEESAKKKNLTILPLSLKESDYNIGNLGSGRKLVKWAFDHDKGDLSDIETFGDKYMVAIVTDKKGEGTQDAKTARPLVEGLLRNLKKAEQITKQIGNSNDLNAIAAANKTTVQKADSISFQSPSIPNAGFEPRVCGAAFAKQNLNKTTAPIAGNVGVFVIKAEQVFAKANPAIDYKVQRQQMEAGLKSNFAYNSMNTLKKAATIKDKRIKFY
ncbi:MAG: SurA N-terminal domain-containing protein [Sphingobacteriales bacterium]|nr:SurA N-terminal domain-containing protein [Sphingobacteriales bacterium]MBI3719065.1 SurA N-terminal domain-containing protein [Sphingobacteriales bacterium]